MSHSATVARRASRAASEPAGLRGVPGGGFPRERPAGRSELLFRLLERVATAAVDQEPLAFCREVVEQVGDCLGARWVVLAVRPRAMPDATIQLLVRDPGGRTVTDVRCLPAPIRASLLWACVRVRSTVVRAGEVYVALTVRGRSQGVLAALQHDGDVLGADEIRVLRVLASQIAAALHHDDVLRRSERTLVAAERSRLATALHETVARQILSAGITVERCRGQVAGTPLHDDLGRAARLARSAVQQLRSAITPFGTQSPDGDLPTLLRRLGAEPVTQPLHVTVAVSGAAHALPPLVAGGAVRIVGECLFNALVHGHARRALVALAYRDDGVVLGVGDDGDGDPGWVRRFADPEADLPGAGHRGLADVGEIVESLEGELAVGRSALGGIQIEVQLPTRAAERRGGEPAHG
jgi:signal transduction histidine kinase